MHQHGFYDAESKKWYCSYFMDEKEWQEIHDYLPNHVINEEESNETTKQEKYI
jgi:hypothetical protein